MSGSAALTLSSTSNYYGSTNINSNILTVTSNSNLGPDAEFDARFDELLRQPIVDPRQLEQLRYRENRHPKLRRRHDRCTKQPCVVPRYEWTVGNDQAEALSASVTSTDAVTEANVTISCGSTRRHQLTSWTIK
jgi:hypothetical protein